MKHLIPSFLVSVLFCTSALRAQRLKTTEIFPPDTTVIDDLSFLKDELAEKQVVMLGEQTHMYGNIFEMKSRVVEFLHEKMGFNTIAMESPMYDLWKMNKKGFDPVIFNEAVFGVWSGTEEFQRLVHYIDKNHLKVIGMDPQVMDTERFIEDFFDYLRTKKIGLKLDEDDLAIVIEGILEVYEIDEDDISYTDYSGEIQRILKEIEKKETDRTDWYWKQFVKNLQDDSQSVFEEEEILTTDFGDKNHNIRDLRMAKNLLHYMDKNPGEKIVVWADNIHVMNDNSSITKPVIKDFVSMGNTIKDSLGESVYSLATLHANDSLYDPQNQVWEATPIEKNSFEQELRAIDKPFLFVSSDQDRMKKEKLTRLLNFIDFTSVRLDQLHDGYIFFSKATLPKGRLAKTKPVNLQKKAQDNKSRAQYTIKGQVLDAESKSPVSFANLILKQEEIYHVASEEGSFAFKLPDTLSHASIEISSVGYESKTIKIDQIDTIISLKPKYEALEEVVIQAYPSPKKLLKEVVRKKKKENYPAEPHNAMRYTQFLGTENDSTLVNLELITKDYDDGYTSKLRFRPRVEEIKWNTNLIPEPLRYTSAIFELRENAVRYANILHQRKYKKFDLHYVKSRHPEDTDDYIIAFKTNRNKWNFTNRPYPTEYSGTIYIDKTDLAVVKIIENWQTKLDRKEIQKIYKGRKEAETYKNMVFKEESINQYTKLPENGRYYATYSFNRSFREGITNEDKRKQVVKERNSYRYDFEFDDVEEIEYEHWEKDKNFTRLDRMEYDPSFWEAFYKTRHHP